MTVRILGQYRRKKCGYCGKVMTGVANRDGLPSYCGGQCARKAQPDKVLIGAGKV